MKGTLIRSPKWLIFASLFVALAIVAVACGDDEAAPTTAPTTAPTATTAAAQPTATTAAAQPTATSRPAAQPTATTVVVQPTATTAGPQPTARPQPTATTPPRVEEPTVTPVPESLFVDPFAYAAGFGDRPRRGGIMKGSVVENYPHFDFNQGFSADIIGLSSLYNGLLMSSPYDYQTAVLPDLAHSWETSPDGRRITFNLHEGITWHDGVPFTAADVKWNYERIMFNGLVGGVTDNQGANFWLNTMWSPIFDSFEAPDPHTFVINLNGPSPFALVIAADGYSKVLPRHIGESDPTNAFKEDLSPVGTGPLRVVGEISTTLNEQERNPDYFKPGLPWIDGYEIHVILDIQTRATAVLTQRVFWNNPTALPFLGFELARSIAEQDPGIVHEGISGLFPLAMFLNAARPPLDDLRIRQAISEAIDRPNLLTVDPLTGIEGLGTQRGNVATAYPPYSAWATSPEVISTFIGYGPDMEARRQHARDLIADYEAENGPVDWSSGPENNCMANHVSCEVAVLLQSDLQKVGIDFPIAPGEIIEVFGRTVDGTLDTTQWFSVTEFDDPSAYIGQMYTTGAGFGFGQKPPPAGLDDIWQGQLFASQDERLAAAEEMDRLVMNDANILTLYFGISEHIRRDFVRGWGVRPFYFDAMGAMEYLWLDLPELPFADQS